MTIYELEGCCSALVLVDLWGTITSKKIKEELAGFISEYHDYTSIDLREYPTFLMATTRTNEQKEAEKALTELGFKAKAFYGRHQPKTGKKTKYLKFWTRSGLPRGVLTRAKQIRKENYNDNW